MSDADLDPAAAQIDSSHLKPFENAYNAYMMLLAPAWQSSEFQQQGAEAFQRYVLALQEAWRTEEQQRVLDAWTAYVTVVQDSLASKEVSQRAEEGLRSYVLSLKEAWSQVDADALDPRSLLAINQLLSSAVWVAAAGAGFAHTLTDQSAGRIG
jgi:hypothetical protein